MKECVFCRMVLQQEPCHKIYEDDQIFAILVPRPIREGHAIIITKYHHEDFLSLPIDVAQHVMTIAQKIGQKMKAVFAAPKIGTVISGFGVAHFHYHVIPLFNEQDISSSAYAKIVNGNIEFKTEFCRKAEGSELENIARMIFLDA
jgi:histidine triad (HIT) family protein